jgi:hypothetical protein
MNPLQYIYLHRKQYTEHWHTPITLSRIQTRGYVLHRFRLTTVIHMGLKNYSENFLERQKFSFSRELLAETAEFK